MTSSVAPIIGLLIAAFLSPGPNNLIVLGAAARGGFWRTIPIIAGIIFGTTVLYLVAATGLAHVFATQKTIFLALLVAGVAYLVHLGIQGLCRKDQNERVQHAKHDPTLMAMALLQLVNPKGLILIGTIAGASADGELGTLSMIVLIALTIAMSLSIWALAGTDMIGYLSNARMQRIFDGILGLLLIASALMILLFGWSTLR